jgi:hypothetical protein
MMESQVEGKALDCNPKPQIPASRNPWSHGGLAVFRSMHRRGVAAAPVEEREISGLAAAGKNGLLCGAIILRQAYG